MPTAHNDVDNALFIFGIAATAFICWSDFHTGVHSIPEDHFLGLIYLISVLTLAIVTGRVIFGFIFGKRKYKLEVLVIFGLIAMFRLFEGRVIFSRTGTGESTYEEFSLHEAGTWHQRFRYEQVRTDYSFGSYTISHNTIFLHRDLQHLNFKSAGRLRALVHRQKPTFILDTEPGRQFRDPIGEFN